MATTNTSPSRRAPSRYLACPTCSTSKQPLASTMRSPRFLRSRSFGANCSTETILFRVSIFRFRAPAFRVGSNRGDKFFARDRSRTTLHYDNASRIVGDARGLQHACPRRQRQRERRNDGVSRAGHVNRLIAPINGERLRRASSF